MDYSFVLKFLKLITCSKYRTPVCQFDKGRSFSRIELQYLIDKTVFVQSDIRKTKHFGHA